MIVADVNANIDVIGDALSLVQNGDNTVTLDVDADVTSANGAIAAISNVGNALTDVDIAAGTTSQGVSGISIDSGAAGSGARQVLIAGSVTATGGSALSLSSTAAGTSSTVEVANGGVLSGSTTGLSLVEVSAPVDLDIAGTVSGGTTAVEISGTGATIDLDLDDTAIVSGVTNGIVVTSGMATAITADIASGATVTGTGGAALAFDVSGTSSLDLTIGGIVSGDTGLSLSGDTGAPIIVALQGQLIGTGGTGIDASGLLLNLWLDGDLTGDILGGAPGSALVFTSGVVDGDIVLTSGADTIDLGTVDVTGTINTGDGADTVTMSNGEQRIGTAAGATDPKLDLGAGDDRLIVVGAGGQFDDLDGDGILDVRQDEVGDSNARLFSASGGAGTGDVITISEATTSAEAFEDFTDFETLILNATTFDTAQLGGTTRMLTFRDLVIGAGSTVLGDGNSPMRTTTMGSVTNGGIGIDLRDQTMGTIDAVAGDGDDALIIGGDYIGDGGAIFLDAALDATGEGSPDRAGDPDGPDADFIVVNGDVSGTSTVIVVNDIGNGVGSLTGATGIVLVEVDGNATAGDFTLAGGTISTAGFIYSLDFDSVNSAFVLRSEVSGAAMQYPVVANAAFGFGVDLLGTMAQRSAARQGYGAQADLGEMQQLSFAEVERGYAGGSWIRVLAASGESDGDITGLPIDADFDHSRTAIQAGYDFELSRTATSTVMGSVSIHAGRMTQDASGAGGAIRADGDADMFGLGFGATYTTNTGFYMDAGINVSSFDFSFETTGAGRGDTDGTAVTAKVEVGQRFEMDNFTLIPQAQLTVGQTSIDSFTDSIGVDVDFDDGDFAELRLGVRAESELANGGLLYGGLDVISDLSGETTTTVAGTELSYEEDGASVKFSGGFRSAPLGATSSFFGELGYENGSDRSETTVTGGVSLRF